MAQELFNTAGVQQKQKDLYALTQSALDIEADVINTQFKDWVRKNFLLTQEQDDFLTLITGTFLQGLAADTSDTVRARQPIQLKVTNPGGPKSSKRINEKRCRWRTKHKNGTEEDGGELTLEIIYDPA